MTIVALTLSSCGSGSDTDADTGPGLGSNTLDSASQIDDTTSTTDFLDQIETSVQAADPDRTEASDPAGQPEAPQPNGVPVAIETVGDVQLARVAPESIELLWLDGNGEPFEQLEAARLSLEAEGKTVRLITNSGLYKPGLSPAGLHIEDGIELAAINLSEGDGNFHLMPNGVFLIDAAGAAVVESTAYVDSGRTPRLAVQSGPMLTIDNAIHPQFGPNSNSRFVRNAVGVADDGTVVFALTTSPVTLWDFAEVLLNAGVPNSLYLDGSIARMDIPVKGQPIPANEPFAGMFAVIDEP